jgi:hypothetical protein
MTTSISDSGVTFADNSVQARAVFPVPVRQTVLSGPVDINGFSAFGGSTGSTTVTATGTLRATAANGFDATGQLDYEGSTTNPSWTSLSTNGTMYLYLDIAAAGTCTTGSTTLAPTYRWGGADVATSGQFTFNIQEMVGKVGNGSVATQTYRVFVGEVTVAGGVTTAITWYQLMGRYQGAFVATFPAGSGTAISLNHNIGSQPDSFNLDIKCTTTELGYAVGDVVRLSSSPAPTNYNTLTPWATAKTCGFTTGSSATQTGIINKSTGVFANITAANWSYRMTALRGW